MAPKNKGTAAHGSSSNKGGKGSTPALTDAQKTKLAADTAAAIKGASGTTPPSDNATPAAAEQTAAKTEETAAPPPSNGAEAPKKPTSYSAQYSAKMRKLPVHLRTTTKLRRAIERFESWAKQAKTFDPKAIEVAEANSQVKGVTTAPSELIAKAEKDIATAIALLEAIPEDYKAPRKLAGAAAAAAGKSGGLAMDHGDVVAIREKRRASYTDDLTATEMGHLIVHDTRKNKVVCITDGGVKVFIPKAHLEKTGKKAETQVQPAAPAQQ